MGKKFIANIILIPIILLLPLLGYAAIGAHHIYDANEANGNFIVSVWHENSWQPLGTLSFNRFYSEKDLSIREYSKNSGTIRIKIQQLGGGAAHIDSIFFGKAMPTEVKGVDNGIRKLSKRDHDVVDAFNKSIEVVFPASENDKTLKLTARIEDVIISKTPFQYPSSNLYKEITPKSDFYTYKITQLGNTLSIDNQKPFFKEYSVTGSGHPSGFTYGWIRNDEKNLYVKMDFTPDNTMDGDKDYAKVYIKTDNGVKEFKVSMKDTKWGTPHFIYTKNVSYEHKVYDFQIPLKELGINEMKEGEPLSLAFSAYGTANPPDNAFVPPDNRFLVVYERWNGSASDIYGQFVDQFGDPTGSEFAISDMASVQQVQPAVAYNSQDNEFLVVWRDARNSGLDIYGRRVSANGTFPGSSFRITDDTVTNTSQNWPSVAYNSQDNQFLVAWEDSRNTHSDIYGQRVDANGTLLDSGVNFLIANDSNNRNQFNASVAYNSQDNQFLVVWDDNRRAGTDYDIWGRRLDADGTAPATGVTVDFRIDNDGTNNNTQQSPKAAYNSQDNEFLVVWEDNRNANYDIYGQAIAALGTLLDSGNNFRVNDDAGTASQTYPDIAYGINDNQFLVVWEDDRNIVSTSVDVYGRLINADRSFDGSSVPIANSTSGEYTTAVAYNSVCSNFLISYWIGGSPDTPHHTIFGPPCPEDVPTMTQWGMIIFMVLAGLGGIYFMRRKVRANN